MCSDELQGSIDALWKLHLPDTLRLELLAGAVALC